MKLLLENWRRYIDQKEQDLFLEHWLLEEGVGDWVKEKWQQLRNVNQKALAAAAQEWRETKEVAPILKRLLSGEEVSEAEQKQLNDQAIDVLKTAGWGAITIVPGTLGGVIAMIYILQKFGLNPLPSSYGGEQNEAPT